MTLEALLKLVIDLIKEALNTKKLPDETIDVITALMPYVRTLIGEKEEKARAVIQVEASRILVRLGLV